MQTSPAIEIKEELAPRLRWAVTRLARRLRQEAGAGAPNPWRARRGAGAAQALARAQDRLPRQAPRRARRRGPPHARARGGAAGGDARMTGALERSFASLSIPNFRRYFT